MSCAGRSESHGETNGGSSTGGTGGATGGVGAGATGKAGDWYGPEGGGARNLPGNGGKGASGGSAVVGGNGGVGGDAGAGAVSGFPCIGGSVASQDLVDCEGGFAHRPTAARCPPPPPDLEVVGAAEGGAGGEGGAPSDCGGAYCALGEACIETLSDIASVSYCSRVCETDADCTGGSICACVPDLFRNPNTGDSITVGLCTRSTCATDADCAPGSLCIAPYRPVDCGIRWVHEFHCQTPADECASSAQCSLEECRYDGTRFACHFAEHC